MSRFLDRVKKYIENEISEEDLLQLYGKYAECMSDCRSISPIYYMDDLNHILDNKQIVEARERGEFSTDNLFFTTDDGFGDIVSFDNLFEHIDIDSFASFLITKHEDVLYDIYRSIRYPYDLESILDGTEYSNRINECIRHLSTLELNYIADCYWPDDESVLTRDDLVQCVQNALFDEYNGEPKTCHSFVFRFPKELQEIFFDYTDTDIDYAKENIGIKGPLPADEALEIAGFKKTKKDTFSIGHEEYCIPFKNGVIQSVSCREKVAGR